MPEAHAPHRKGKDVSIVNPSREERITYSREKELLETGQTQTQINVHMYVRPTNHFAAGNMHTSYIRTTQQTNPYAHGFDYRQTTL